MQATPHYRLEVVKVQCMAFIVCANNWRLRSEIYRTDAGNSEGDSARSRLLLNRMELFVTKE